MEKEVIEEQKPSAKVGVIKRIISMALVVICAGLVIAISLCSFLPKSFNPGLNEPNYIRIFSSSNENINNTTYSSDSDEYKQIMSLYGESFETTIFGALFQGKANEGVSFKEGYQSLSSLSGTYIEFNYNEVQTIKLNGKTLKEAGIDTQFSNQNYRSVVIEVVDSDSFAQINVYFRYNDSGSTTYSYLRFLTFAKQSALYDYLQKL
ncbi:MAG TPA: hypothetical protein DCO89_00405 [Clostridiales bacterium]|nr:hypothetical protein [Clostridiales bacterium]